MALIDWHSHILPAVDDGPDDIAESGTMLKAAVNAGIEVIACTYHNRPGYWEPSLQDAENALSSLRSIRDGNHPELHLICEAHLDSELPAKAERNEIALLGGKVFLLELPFLNPQVALNSALFFKNLGLLPIICHPERYIEGEADMKTLERLRNAGCLIQVNACSLIGNDGNELMLLCRKMIKFGLVDLLGSDSHSATDGRLEALATAYKKYPDFVGRGAELLNDR